MVVLEIALGVNFRVLHGGMFFKREDGTKKTIFYYVGMWIP